FHSSLHFKKDDRNAAERRLLLRRPRDALGCEPITPKTPIIPWYFCDSQQRSRVNQSRICEDCSMMQKGQLLILFGHQATGRCLNRVADETSIRARHLSEG